jgi:hypothetical protein
MAGKKKTTEELISDRYFPIVSGGIGGLGIIAGHPELGVPLLLMGGIYGVTKLAFKEKSKEKIKKAGV